MLEVRCSSAERLSGDLRALPRSPIGSDAIESEAIDVDDVTMNNPREPTSAVDIDVESILARARENVMHSRRLRLQGHSIFDLYI